MESRTLYKYLDVNGGLAMLEHHNLQYTNATKFNDSFDCHPALFDYSNVPVTKNNWPPADFQSIYLGVNIYPKNKDGIIEAAKKLNPEIKIYQMTIDPEAFKLKEKEIEEI